MAEKQRRSLKTKNFLHFQIYKFWLNIFAMGIGVGVVTGLVLSFEFGLAFNASRWEIFEVSQASTDIWRFSWSNRGPSTFGSRLLRISSSCSFRRGDVVFNEA